MATSSAKFAGFNGEDYCVQIQVGEETDEWCKEADIFPLKLSGQVI